MTSFLQEEQATLHYYIKDPLRFPYCKLTGVFAICTKNKIFLVSRRNLVDHALCSKSFYNVYFDNTEQIIKIFSRRFFFSRVIDFFFTS